MQREAPDPQPFTAIPHALSAAVVPLYGATPRVWPARTWCAVACVHCGPSQRGMDLVKPCVVHSWLHENRLAPSAQRQRAVVHRVVKARNALPVVGRTYLVGRGTVPTFLMDF